MAAKKKSSPAKSSSKTKAKPTAKKAPASAKAVKAAKPIAKKAKAAPAKKAKATAATKAAKPTKTAKPTKAAKPAKSEQPKKSQASSLVNTVKRAAAKVVEVVASAASKALDGGAVDAGRAAPAFELQDEKGESVSSSSLSGKPYLLYFYPKDDTPGCTKEACDVRDNFGSFGQQGLRVFGVSPDSTQSHAKFGKKYGLPFTLLSDPDKQLAKAYGVWGPKKNYGKEYMGIVRSSFLIGGDGVIKKAYRGVRVDGHVAAILEDAKGLL